MMLTNANISQIPMSAMSPIYTITFNSYFTALQVPFCFGAEIPRNWFDLFWKPKQPNNSEELL